MQQFNKRTSGDSHRRQRKALPLHTGIVHWHHLPARGHSSHKTSLLESYGVRGAGVMPVVVSCQAITFHFLPNGQSKDENAPHPTPSEMSFIDHMFDGLRTIQHDEASRSMSHSPQWVTLCYRSWRFSRQLIDLYFKDM